MNFAEEKNLDDSLAVFDGYPPYPVDVVASDDSRLCLPGESDLPSDGDISGDSGLSGDRGLVE